MNLRLLVKGLLGCMLYLVGTALCPALPPSGLQPMPSPALSPALPPSLKPVVEPAKDDAVDAANPYSVIVERNIFHLNPPPPKPEPEKPKVELPVIKITGIVDISGQKKVLFLSEPKDKKEGPFYYSLSEGENGADGSHKLELVKIHPSQDGVDVVNDGVAVTLTMKDDTLGSSAAPAAATVPAAAGAKERPPGSLANGMPGRQIHPGGMFPPGVPGAPGAGQNGFGAPARRRSVPPGVPQ
jgi:hypothetical protein